MVGIFRHFQIKQRRSNRDELDVHTQDQTKKLQKMENSRRVGDEAAEDGEFTQDHDKPEETAEDELTQNQEAKLMCAEAAEEQ